MAAKKTTGWMFSLSKDEVQEFLKFRNHGSKINNKKGKGSYRRKDKHPNKDM